MIGKSFLRKSYQWIGKTFFENLMNNVRDREKLPSEILSIISVDRENLLRKFYE